MPGVKKTIIISLISPEDNGLVAPTPHLASFSCCHKKICPKTDCGPLACTSHLWEQPTAPWALQLWQHCNEGKDQDGSSLSSSLSKPSHLPAKYSGWYWLLAFLHLSRTILSTPHIPFTSVSTRSPNLPDHYHMLLISILLFTSLNLDSISLAPFLHYTLWNSWFAISKLSCFTLFSEYLLPLLSLTETWLSLSSGRCLFFHPSFTSGPVGR